MFAQVNSSVIIKHNVLSVPLKVYSSEYEFEGGLADTETGQLIEQAVIVRHGKMQQTLLTKAEISAYIPEVNETIFYGGILFDNFGHFLLESLSRLWAYRLYSKEKLRILFYCPWGIPSYKKKSDYVYQVLKGFDIPVKRLVFFNDTVRLKKVVVPTQAYGFGTCRNPGKEFLDFINSFHFKQKISLANRRHEKVYVSRSALPYNAGRPLGEVYFEKYLKENGYLIFHPQKHTVYEQLSLY